MTRKSQTTIEQRIAALHRLNDEGWARHANPWSGWTRFVTCLPLFVLAVWSRVWLGWWALVPVALAVLWIWLNQRAFGPAKSDQPWIAKGVFGERFWTQRHDVPIPERHRTAPHLINLAAATGALFLVWGLWTLDGWATFVGVVLSIGGKLWYLDRMALLYDEVVEARPDLRFVPAG